MRQTRPTFHRSSWFAGAVIVLATVAPADAQTLPRFDQQIVVTPLRVDSPVSEVPAFVTVVDADDIAQSPARDIPDLLRQAGAQVTDITGNGRSYRVDLRGFGATAASNTLVLVDGRRVNQPDLGGTDWTQIPLDHVARIEIIRGSGAVAFGDNATGGVVNIVTKDGGEPERRVAFKAGAYQTLASEASARGTRGGLSYAVSGRYQQSDGHRLNADTSSGDVAGQVVVRPGGMFELAVSGGVHDDTTGLPGSLTETVLASGVDRSDSVTPDDVADIGDGYVMATPRFSLGSRGHVLVDVSVRQRDTELFSSFTGGSFTGDTAIRTVATSPKGVFVAPAGATTHRVVVGGDLTTAEEGIRNTVVFGGVPDAGRFTLEKTGRAVYVRDDVSAGIATVSAGYRYDGATYTFTPSTPATRSFHAHAGEAGATVRVSDHASVFAGLSRSFRYPVLDELFDFFSNTIVDDLVPQASVDVQGGVRIEAGASRASVSIFQLATDDEIFFNPAGGFGIGANENLDGRTRRVGLEMTVAALLGRASVSGTLSLVETTIEGGPYDGQRIPGVAARRASVQARVPVTRRTTLSLDGTYTGPRRFEGDFDDRYGRQTGYFLLDARVIHEQGRARLFVDVKNLLDEEYSEFGVIGGFPPQRAYYPSPGVHALTGIDVTF
jgi:iron complex outermembrane receptor protein